MERRNKATRTVRGLGFLIIKKDTPIWCVLFWCARRDLNPHTEVHAPKTCVSANFTTGASAGIL